MGYKKFSAHLLSEISRGLPKNSHILDVGCGSRAYEHLFLGRNYQGIDVKVSGRTMEHKRPDIYFDGESIPTEKNRFDLVIFTEVLEHCANPGGLLDEIYRVLKPGGKLYATTPFMWGEHEMPFDFRRYTSEGLKKAFRHAKFEVLDFKKEGHGVHALYKVAASEIAHQFKGAPIRRLWGKFMIGCLYIGGRLMQRLVNMERIYLCNHIIAIKRTISH